MSDIKQGTTFVPASARLDFMESLSQADNDSRTSGFFLLMIAPRSDGFARESVLCIGELPFDAVMERVIQQSADRLAAHNGGEVKIRTGRGGEFS